VTKRERVAAAIAGRPVDRPPVSFWRHVPEVDHRPAGLAEAMLAFHRRWDLDLIKLMSSGVYCVEDWGCRVAYRGAPSGAKECTAHAVQSPADWERLRPLDPGAGALGRELEALRLVVRDRDDDAPVLHTLFSPLTIARKLAGDRLAGDLATAPTAVGAALAVIEATVLRYAAAAREAGADGFFLASQAAGRERAGPGLFERHEGPALGRLAAALRATGGITVLHLHGRDVFWDACAALPVDVVNWHDRVTAPSLAEARARRPGALAAGLSEGETLRRGGPAAAAAEARDAIAQTGGRGHLLTPGCVLPLDVPDAALAAVVAAVRAARLDGSRATGAGSAPGGLP
jgi:uroporphyrinogen decarboxylase